MKTKFWGANGRQPAAMTPGRHCCLHVSQVGAWSQTFACLQPENTCCVEGSHRLASSLDQCTTSDELIKHIHAS